MPQTLHKHSTEFKYQIVDLYRTGHWSYLQLKRKYGISQYTIIKWVNQVSITKSPDETVALSKYRILQKQLRGLKADFEVSRKDIKSLQKLLKINSIDQN